MSATVWSDGLHPDDGVLMRLLDGECEREEAARLHAHLPACRQCTARVAMLEGLARRFGKLLAAAEPPLRAARPSGAAAQTRLAMRVAAGVLVAATVAAGAQPVRRWIAARWPGGGLSATAAPHAVAAPPAAQAAPRADLSFVPAGTTLAVTFRSRQAAGTLTLAPVADDAATFGSTGGPGSPAVTVLPNGFVIDNEAASRASYRVAVPAQVRQVTVRVDGTRPLALPWSPATAARTVELRAAAR